MLHEEEGGGEGRGIDWQASRRLTVEAVGEATGAGAGLFFPFRLEAVAGRPVCLGRREEWSGKRSQSWR